MRIAKKFQIPTVAGSINEHRMGVGTGIVVGAFALAVVCFWSNSRRRPRSGTLALAVYTEDEASGANPPAE
jgi:hypothetical protein